MNKENIELAWENNKLLKKEKYIKSVEAVIENLDNGQVRVSEPYDNGWYDNGWKVNEWVKKAVLLYFSIKKMKKIELSNEIEFYDKIPLKKDFDKKGIRVVPPAFARYGSYVSSGAILMPSYVNIGAYVDSGTMVDTWATVGSCAQIGKNVHLSGGVGIGGVLEPPQASPVIIEDGCFLGSRCIVVEGVHVGKEAVLGANVVLTKSSKIIDVTEKNPYEYNGYIPPRSVVIPGSRPKEFKAGVYNIPCALIIGKRKKSTDLKTSLNQVLREHNVTV